MPPAPKKLVIVMVDRRGKAKRDLERPRLLEDMIKQPELLAKIQLSAQEAGLDKLSDAEIDAEIAAYRSKND